MPIQEEKNLRKLIRELNLLAGIEPWPREEIRKDLERYLKTGEVIESVFTKPTKEDLQRIKDRSEEEEPERPRPWYHNWH